MAIGFLIIFVLLNKIIMRIKTILVGLSLLFVLSCVNQQNANKSVKTKIEKSHKRNLRKQLASFIKGMRKGKPDEVKAYFDFPIKNDNFWYVALESEKWEKHLGKGFGEKEFQTYFNGIFNDNFRKTLAKIDVDKVLKQGRDEAEYTNKSSSEDSKNTLEIVYADDKITITFNSTVYYEDMPDEYSQVFVFTTKDGVLKFKDFQIAG
jgi:hypothetical protein